MAQAASDNAIRVLLVEDQLIPRMGLKLVVGLMPGMEAVGEAENGELAVELALKCNPDVIVMDLAMPVMDGIEATRRIKEANQDIRVLMLTSIDHEDNIYAALAAGADGYCLKEAKADVIELAIRAVHKGTVWLDPAIAGRILSASLNSRQNTTPACNKTENSGKTDKPGLSAREYEVLQLIVDGLSNKEIAERLNLRVETVKTHMRHIMEKMSVGDRTQAAVKALRQGLLT